MGTDRGLVVKSFLIKTLKDGVFAYYPDKINSDFSYGFKCGLERTKGLIDLVEYSPGGQSGAVYDAFRGLQIMNKDGRFDVWDFKGYGSGTFENVFPGITELPFVYGAIRGVDAAAEVITLGKYDTHGFILRELEKFEKEQKQS